MIEATVLTPDDWRVWRRLRLQALEEAPVAFSSTLADWSGGGDTEQRWRARLRNVALNLVVMRGGKAAGMVSATAPDGEGRVGLISLWVLPTSRARGVGDEAVRQNVGWANQHHPTSPVVLSVKTDNNRAVDLYERNGFLDAGPSPDDVTERLMVRPSSARRAVT